MEDQNGEELAGVEIWLMWAGGADRAVTGLKPQNGRGYVDFSAETGVSYTLSIGELGIPLATNLRIDTCPSGEDIGPLPGSWRIVIERRLIATE